MKAITKKFLILLAVTLVVSTFTGCEDSKTKVTENTPANSEQNATTPDNTTPVIGNIGKDVEQPTTETNEVAEEPAKPKKKSQNGFYTNQEVIVYLVTEEDGNAEYLNKLVESGVDLTQIPNYFLKGGNPKSGIIPGLVTEQLKKQGGVKSAKEVRIKADSRTDLTELLEATQLEVLYIEYDHGRTPTSAHPGENYGVPILPDLSNLTNLKKLSISGGMWITDEQMGKIPTNLDELFLINPFITSTEFVENYPNLLRLHIISSHGSMLDTVSNLEYLERLIYLTIETKAEVTITEASRDFIKNHRILFLEMPTIAGVIPTSGGAVMLTLSDDKATDLSWVPTDIESSRLTISGHKIKDLSGLKNILDSPKTNKVILQSLRNADFTTIKDEVFEELELAGTFWNPKGLGDVKVSTITLSNPNIELLQELAKTKHVNHVRLFKSPTRDLSIFKDSSVMTFHVDYKSVDLETIPGTGNIYVEGITTGEYNQLPKNLKIRVTPMN